MYTLNYKVTTSTCDNEGKLKLYSALQMMQDCSEMWIDSEPTARKFFHDNNMTQLLAARPSCRGIASHRLVKFGVF